MCELFGLSSKKKVDCIPWLHEFFSHCNEHPHGWGIATVEEGVFKVRKEAVPAEKSGSLKHILSRPLEKKLLLAHIRLATKGSIEYKNTHPFVGTDVTGREWILIHNGTIFECNELSEYIHKQEGSTDSERILLYLMDSIKSKVKEKGSYLGEKEMFEVIEKVILTIAPENKLNLMITDGITVYVHTNYEKSLYKKNEDSTAVFSTRPLDDGAWEGLPMNTLLAYQDGKEICRGKTHEYEYFDTEEKLRYLFLDYAGI